MTDHSKMNLLFFLGVLIPALVTVGLFAVFCYCWYRMRIRNQILYKKHDPHKIEKLKDGQVYEPPPPPLPPFKSNLTLFQESLQHNNNNEKKINDNYEESPEPTEGIVNTMYKTNGDSGFSDLNQIHCDVNNSEVQRPLSDGLRPNSQASDDSDDSGFRSSRSGQYIHSASDSAGNPHDFHPHSGVSSCQVHDTVPLFKPIKIHPNEFGQLPSVSYVHRSSTSSKYRNNRHRKPPISSSPFYSMGSESHNINKLNAIYHIDQTLGFPPLPHRNSVPPSARHNCNTRHISLSNYDVHGGRLHSIDSHYGPLTSPGHYGTRSSMDNCGHQHSAYGDGLIPRADSIGYGSVSNSSLGYMPNMEQPGSPLQIPHEHLFPPQTHQFNNFTTQNPFPISTTNIPGYTISHTSHMRPIQPDVSVQHKLSEPLQTVPEASVPLTVTQAMVHRPYIEELSDPSLYSVV